MIELESYMAPIPFFRNSGAGPQGTGKTVLWQSPKMKSIKNPRRHLLRRRGAWFASLLAHLS